MCKFKVYIWIYRCIDRDISIDIDIDLMRSIYIYPYIYKAKDKLKHSRKDLSFIFISNTYREFLQINKKKKNGKLTIIAIKKNKEKGVICSATLAEHMLKSSSSSRHQGHGERGGPSVL